MLVAVWILIQVYWRWGVLFCSIYGFSYGYQVSIITINSIILVVPIVIWVYESMFFHVFLTFRCRNIAHFLPMVSSFLTYGVWWKWHSDRVFAVCFTVECEMAFIVFEHLFKCWIYLGYLYKLAAWFDLSAWLFKQEYILW